MLVNCAPRPAADTGCLHPAGRAPPNATRRHRSHAHAINTPVSSISMTSRALLAQREDGVVPHVLLTRCADGSRREQRNRSACLHATRSVLRLTQHAHMQHSNVRLVLALTGCTGNTAPALTKHRCIRASCAAPSRACSTRSKVLDVPAARANSTLPSPDSGISSAGCARARRSVSGSTPGGEGSTAVISDSAAC